PTPSPYTTRFRSRSERRPSRDSDGEDPRLLPARPADQPQPGAEHMRRYSITDSAGVRLRSSGITDSAGVRLRLSGITDFAGARPRSCGPPTAHAPSFLVVHSCVARSSVQAPQSRDE